MTKSGKDLPTSTRTPGTAMRRPQDELVQGMAQEQSAEGGDREVPSTSPHVIEPSAGADRFTLAVLCEAYTEDKLPDAKGNLEERLVMKFHPRLAPMKAAILPLVKKDGMPEKAAGALPGIEETLQGRVRRRRSDRPALSPAGRDRHAVLHHHRRRHAQGRHGHDPRSRHAASSGACLQARCSTRFARRWAEPARPSPCTPSSTSFVVAPRPARSIVLVLIATRSAGAVVVIVVVAAAARAAH